MSIPPEIADSIGFRAAAAKSAYERLDGMLADLERARNDLTHAGACSDAFDLIRARLQALRSLADRQQNWCSGLVEHLREEEK